MKATITLDLSTPQANLLLGYLETLPFATVKIPKSKAPKEPSKWQQALDEGAVTLDEFFDELDESIKAHFRHA